MKKWCVEGDQFLLDNFADNPPGKLVIISILAAFLKMDSSAVKQFSSIVPEAEIMCVTNTGDGQTATVRSPLRNLKSTQKTTEQVMIRVPPEGTIIPRNQRAPESLWVRQGLQLNYPVVGGKGSLWDQKRAGRLFPATSSEEAGQKAALNLCLCFLFP